MWARRGRRRCLTGHHDKNPGAGKHRRRLPTGHPYDTHPSQRCPSPDDDERKLLPAERSSPPGDDGSKTAAMKRASGGAPSSPSTLFVSVACLLLSIAGPPLVAAARLRLLTRKPDPSDAAATARWLASQNSWGVLSTISVDLGGAPFGNVVSFSDGLPGEGYGIPYFYLTTLDPTARDASKDERASFTVSEFPIGSCGKRDPENPTCAKLTLTGKLKLVDSNSTEGKSAQLALFAKHAEMKDWPKGHNFQIFKLDIHHIFLIDWFGGAKPITVDQYLNPTLNQLS